MKTFFTQLSFLFAFMAFTNLHAQVSEEEKIASLDNESNRKHMLKTNLLSAVTKSFSLSYENAVTNKLSLQAGAYYSQSKMFKATERLSITLELKKYLSRQENALVGFYLAPYLKYQNLKDTEENFNGDVAAKATIYTLGGGLLIGKQWIAKRGFTVDIYAGGGLNPVVNLANLQVIDATETYTFSESDWQTDIRLGVSVGFAF